MFDDRIYDATSPRNRTGVQLRGESCHRLASSELLETGRLLRVGGEQVGAMRLTIVGKNPRAAGSECVIFGHIDRNGAFAPVDPRMRAGKELAAYGGWEMRQMRPGLGLATAPALVGWTERSDFCRTSGRLVVLSHRWSGLLQVNDVARKYVVDLYSEPTRLILLDVVNEIVVDVTGLAACENGRLSLPEMSVETFVRHIVETGAWFRFVEGDAQFRPGPLRRTIAAFRRPPDERLKLRLVAALLPTIAAPPPPAPPRDDSSLHDEFRLLAAAVEGLALRAPA